MNNATMYIVKVYEGEEAYEYEYSNLKHATEHFEMESGKTELIAYYWDVEKHESRYETISSN